ncbi:hypothetical protein GCK32_015577 [Trichostrongylus colubriformis]|uniref:Uncharacterized protein n=1 Tax=Trichostrongylus colubriformis TaxID=6319 RepID=A0AAN8F205_TRICO
MAYFPFMLYRGSLLCCHVILILVQKAATLSCVHGPAGKALRKVGGNICVLYELDSCKAPKRYYDGFTVSDPVKLEGFCGAYKNNSNKNITACFCQEDDCNRETTIRELLSSLPIKQLTLPVVGTWKFEPHVEHTRQLLECLRKNLYSPANKQEDAGNDRTQEDVGGTKHARDEMPDGPNVIMVASVLLLVFTGMACCVATVVCWLCKENAKNRGSGRSVSEKSQPRSHSNR